MYHIHHHLLPSCQNKNSPCTRPFAHGWFAVHNRSPVTSLTPKPLHAQPSLTTRKWKNILVYNTIHTSLITSLFCQTPPQCTNTYLPYNPIILNTEHFPIDIHKSETVLSTSSSTSISTNSTQTITYSAWTAIMPHTLHHI